MGTAKILPTSGADSTEENWHDSRAAIPGCQPCLKANNDGPKRPGWWGKGGIAPLTGRRGSINEALKALTVRPAILAKLKNPRKTPPRASARIPT